MSIIGVFRSAANTVWRSIALIARAGICFVRGQRTEASEHLRFLGLLVHDDLVAFVVLAQRALGRPKVPTLVRRILIVKLDRIGDMVNTTPVFDALAETYPGARLDIVGHPVPLSLLESDTRIVRRFEYRTRLYHATGRRRLRLGRLAVVASLFRERYDLVVYLRGSFPWLALGLVSRFAAAKYQAGEPVVARYIKAIEPFTGPVAIQRPRLAVTDRLRPEARERLVSGRERRGARIVVHATTNGSARQWPAERFVAVADALKERFDADVHFLGSDADRRAMEWALQRAKFVHAGHFNLSLPEAVATIAEADLLIGNDSGLGHIAAAANTPAVLIWGAANLNMARPAADPDRCVILYRDLPCRDICDEIRCVNERHLECLQSIQPSEVIEAAALMLRVAPHRVSA